MINNKIRYILSRLTCVVLALGMSLAPAGVLAAPVHQDDAPPDLVYGQTVDDRIDSTQPSVFYTFDAAAGDVVTITMIAASDALDPFIVLNTNDRTPLETDDNSGGNRNARLTFTIPDAGRYVIQATNAGGVPPDDAGDFSLNLTAAVDSVPTPTTAVETDDADPTASVQTAAGHIVKLADGRTIEAELTRQMTLRYYWFEAGTGDQVSFTPGASDGFQPLYVLYDVAFNEIDRVTDSDALRVSIPDDGVYFFSVSLPEASSDGGAYSFSFDRLPNPATSEDYLDIVYGESVNGTIDAAASAITYRFQGAADDNVTITMSRMSGDLNSYLYLLDSTGELIFEDNDSGSEAVGDARITYSLPDSGAYLIVATRLGQAQGSTTGTFLLELQSDADGPASTGDAQSSAEPTLPEEYATLPQIAYGETVTGELTDAKFMDFYVFRGAEGDDIVVELVSDNLDQPEGLDPLMILLDANRIPLAENDDIVDGVERNARIEYTIPETGYYAIVATRFEQDEGTTAGPYTLTLSGPDDIAADAVSNGESGSSDAVMLDQFNLTTLASGTSQQGTFDGGADLYTFESGEGEQIDITATTDEGLDAVLILADENLNEIASDNAGTLTGVTVPKTGRYLILITTRFGPAEETDGGYILALTQTGDVPATAEAVIVNEPREMAYGDTVTGTINDNIVSQVFTFEGLEGDRVRITMESTPESELDTYLELQNASGDVLEANDDIDPGVIRDSQIVTELPADGTYTVLASRYVGPDTPTTSGSYQLSLEVLGEDDLLGVSSLSTPISYGQTEVGEIDDEQYLLFYVFDGTAGDVVTISVDHLSGNLDSVLHLYRSEGDSWALVTSNDDSPTGGTYAPLLADLTLPQSGKYLIAISRYGMERESSAGTFALTLTLETAVTDQ